jgi:hypothetical protein
MTTISIQRGTVALTGSTGTQSTLFTNSGGVNATRVITNGVMQYYTGGIYPCASAYFGGDILVMPSGNCGGAYFVGRAASGCGSYSTWAQFLTDYRTTSAFPICTSQCTYSGTSCGSMAIQGFVMNGMGCGAQTYTAGCGAASISATYFPCLLRTDCAYYPGFATMLPQFWIGPSDLVKYQSHCNIAYGYVSQGKGGYQASCQCINVTYSFTTVSE